MKVTKRIGIFMDHAHASLIDVTNDDIVVTSVEAAFLNEEKQEMHSRSEHVMHNKQQQQQAAYYKQLADAIVSYDEVLLFGPTNARTELYNILRSDLAFSKITIDVQPADKMTPNQQNAFVKKHFQLA